MTDARPPRRGAYSLAVAFLVAATAAFFGMRWNMLEPRRGVPMGTKLMLVAAVVTAAGSRLVGKTHSGATILTVGVAVPTGALISMLAEMVKDPTSQNLWPVGVVLLAVFAIAASAMGTLMGGLILRLIHATTGRDSGT